MDGDLNHQPEEIPRLVEEAVRRELDILVGSRSVVGALVRGTPIWKRVLSGAFNRCVRPLLGIPVSDSTSGFRVYRREVLERLTIEGTGFAFLPHLLIAAAKQQARVGEAPIEFVYREAGQSKMRLLPTAGSYLHLLMARRRLWSGRAWPAAVLLVGMVLRLAVALPPYRYTAEADALLGAMTAHDVLQGEWPVYMTPKRLGAFGGYWLAGLFAVFGEERWVVHLGPALLGILTMLLWASAAYELLGSDRARRVLPLVALATPAALFWTSMNNAYCEVFFLCTAIVWAAVRIDSRGWSRARALALGLSIGLGGWQSIQTLTCSLPVLVWLFGYRRRLPKPSILLLALGGIGGGLLPLAGGINGPVGANYALEASRSVTAVLGNLWYVVSAQFPELLVSLAYLPDHTTAGPMLRALQLGLLGLAAGSVVVGVAVGLRDPQQRSATLLAVLVVAAVAGANGVSAAGAMRGMTVRFVLPALVAFPLLAAPAFGAAGRFGRALGIAVPVALLALLGATIAWPGTAVRREWTAALARQDALAAAIDGRADVVVGDFWTVYPFNWLLHQRVLALPRTFENDVRSFELEIAPESRGRVVVVEATENAARWRVARARLQALEDGASDGIVGPVASSLPIRDVVLRLRDPVAAGLWVPVFDDGFERGDLGAWSQAGAGDEWVCDAIGRPAW